MTSSDEERVLSGREPRSDELAELAMFARSVRATMLVEPDPGASAALVGLMAAAARASALTVAPKPVVRRRPRLALVARIAVAAALLPLFMAGLAVAGVGLPAPAQSVFEGVGIDLPNQSDNDGSAEDASRGGAGQDSTAGDDAQQPAPAASGGGETAIDAKDEAAKKQGAGKQKSNPARDQGRGHGAQGRGRAIGQDGVPPGHANPNRGGQGKGTAIGKTGGTPPGHTKPSKPSKAKPKPVTPKPPKPIPGADKLKGE